MNAHAHILIRQQRLLREAVAGDKFLRPLRDALHLYGLEFTGKTECPHSRGGTSYEQVAARAEADPDLVYFEGLVSYPGSLGDILDRDAWTVSRMTGGVVAPAGQQFADSIAYLGVPFTLAGVRASIETNRTRAKYPTGTPDKWLGILSAQHMQNRPDDSGLVSFLLRHVCRDKAFANSPRFIKTKP